MATIKFFDEMANASNVGNDDKMMIGKANTGETQVVSFDQVKSFLTIEGQRLAPTAPGALAAGPSGQTRYMEVKTAGTWTWSGNNFVNPEASIMTLWWDGSNWSKVEEVEMPMAEGVDVINPEGENLTKEKAVAEYVKPFLEIVTRSNNLVNTASFVAGSFNENGGYTSTLNSIRLNYTSVPESVRGKFVTISGMGTVPIAAHLIFIRDASNTVIASLNGGGSSDTSPKKIFVPSNADNWAFMIANDDSNGGIGTRPHDNPYVSTFMVNEGEVAMPFEPYNIFLVDPDKIYNPNSIKYSNAITENGEGAVPAKDIFKIKSRLDGMLDISKNIIDMKDPDLIKPGQWTSSGTPNTSLNWIRTEKIDLPPDILLKLANDEEVYMWFSGGGNIPSGGAYAVFWDNDGIPYSYMGEGSMTLPKRIKLEKNYISFAASIANQSSDGGIGSRPLENEFTNTYMISFGENQPEYEPYGEIIKKELLPSNSVSFDLNEIVLVKQNENLIYIYYHSGGASDIWFRINLRHQVNSGRFIDVWRIEGAWSVKRIGDSFTDLFQVVNVGVYENAIYTSGAGYTDALGSAHGWELLDNFSLFADGKEISIGELSIMKCKYLTFTTRTRFVNVSGETTVAYSNKKWEFENGTFRISNYINWLTNLTAGANSYVSMLSIFRKNNEGRQITHTGMSNEDLTPQDIAVSGFTTGIYTDKSNPLRRTLIAWGDEIKAEMTMVKRRVIKPDGSIIENSPNAGMYIQNTSTPDYNKFYGQMGSINIEPGDWWDILTEYKLSNT